MSTTTTNFTPEEKLEQVKPILDSLAEWQIPDTPVPDYIRDSEELNVTASEDAEKLKARGLNPDLLESFPLRIDVCRHVQGLWFNDKKEMTDAREQWKVEAPKAFELRDLLVDEFDFAFHEKPELVSLLKEIREGRSGSDMVQDLTNLGQMAR